MPEQLETTQLRRCATKLVRTAIEWTSITQRMSCEGSWEAQICDEGVSIKAAISRIHRETTVLFGLLGL